MAGAVGGDGVRALPIGIAGARRVSPHVIEIFGDEGRSREGSDEGAAHGEPADDAVEWTKGVVGHQSSASLI